MAHKLYASVQIFGGLRMGSMLKHVTDFAKMGTEYTQRDGKKLQLLSM
jgi:hypothetical protein